MKHLFFDFDGTIANSEEGIISGIHYMIGKMHLPALDDETYHTFIGPALSASLKKYYPDLTADQIKQAVSYYQEIYTKEGVYQLQIYPGVLPALAAIKKAGYQLNVASAKPESMIKTIAAHFHLESYFDGLYGATLDESIRGTKTQVLAYALKQAGAGKKDSLMIGDRDSDMRGGAENGVKTLGVTYGFGSLQELTAAGAKAVIDRPEQLLPAVQALLGK